MAVENLLKEIVGINSVFPSELALGVYVERYLKDVGFRTQRQEVENNRFNILADRGEGRDAILFYGHLDTVPTYGEWSTNPLKLTRRGDRLYGLGSCDMKGGLAVILNTIKQGADRKIKVLICVDEENISRGAWKAVRERRAWFKDVSLAISGEPGDSHRYTGGANVITLGRRGRVVFNVDIRGLASHGANPERGINAIDQASAIVGNLSAVRLMTHSKMGCESIFVRRIEGASTSLSIPDTAQMELDMHLVPPDTIPAAQKRIEAYILSLYRKGILRKQTKVKVSIKKRETPYIPPYVTDEKLPRIREVMKLVSKHVGKPVVNYGTSVADDNIIANVINAPMCTIGPAGGNEHSANEWVSLDSLRRLSGLYRSFVDEI